MIADFAGMMPLRDPILLPDINSQYAENTWLYEGAVRGFRQDTSVYMIKYTDTQQIYRIPTSSANPPVFSSADTLWLEFPDPYMSAIRNPTVGDSWDRYYFFPSSNYKNPIVSPNPTPNPQWPTTSSGPVYNTLGNISNGQPFFLLGVPMPTVAPSVSTIPTYTTHNATAVSPNGGTTITLDSVANITTGMYVADITSQNITLTANAATTPGNNVLHFASTGALLNTVGASILDETTTTVTASTNAQTVAGGQMLNFANTTGIYEGMTVTDLTDTFAIFTGTKVIGVSATQIYINTPTTTLVDVGHQIQFTSAYSDIIPSGTTITATTATTVTMSAATGAAGVLSGDTINFTSSAAIPSGTTVSSIAGNVVTLSNSLVSGGVFLSDQIQFSVTVAESRAYLYTYVTTYNEEGPPSSPTVINGASTGTWTITIPQPPAGINNNRTLAYYNLYRTVTDSQGNANYYRVNKQPIPINWNGTVTINDSALDASITANVQLPSINNLAPPPSLQGVVMMANGIAAGFANSNVSAPTYDSREVWFSQPFLPHAWPPAYALTVDYPIVGLVAIGTSLYIMTEGSPYIATGVTPDTMTISKILSNEPCISRGSIIGSADQAFYASPNGYIELGTGGVNSVTQQICEKEFWYTLQPWNFASGRYALSMAAFIKGQGAPNIDPTPGEYIHGCVIDFTDTNTPFVLLDTFAPVVNAMTDEFSGQLFYITGTNVYQWNPPMCGILWPWIWKTKKFRFTFPQQFKAFMVLFDVPKEVKFTPGVRNTSQTQIYDSTKQWLIVRVFADGQQIVVREVQMSGETLLIPQGSKWTQWEFQFEGIVRMKFFKAATSVHELKVA